MVRIPKFPILIKLPRGDPDYCKNGKQKKTEAEKEKKKLDSIYVENLIVYGKNLIRQCGDTHLTQKNKMGI